MIVVGIDPGSSGAAYELRRAPDGRWGPGDFLRLPFLKSERRAQDLDIAAIADWILARPAVAAVAVEGVGYMPAGKRQRGGEGGGGDGEGGGSGYADAVLSRRVGELVGMVKTLRRRLLEPPARVWQAHIGVKIPRVVGESRAARRQRVKIATTAWAIRTYPGVVLVPPRCAVPHGGLVDALGIATWAAAQVDSTPPPPVPPCPSAPASSATPSSRGTRARPAARTSTARTPPAAPAGGP